MKSDEAIEVYSILEHPERMAVTALTEQEIKALLTRYRVISDFDFTFAGSKHKE